MVQWFTRWTLTWVQISLKIGNSLGGLREANNSTSVIGLKNGNNNIEFHIIVGGKTVVWILRTFKIKRNRYIKR